MRWIGLAGIAVIFAVALAIFRRTAGQFAGTPSSGRSLSRCCSRSWSSTGTGKDALERSRKGHRTRSLRRPGLDRSLRVADRERWKRSARQPGSRSAATSSRSRFSRSSSSSRSFFHPLLLRHHAVCRQGDGLGDAADHAASPAPSSAWPPMSSSARRKRRSHHRPLHPDHDAVGVLDDYDGGNGACLRSGAPRLRRRWASPRST